MTSAFVEAVGEKAADRWTAALFGPETLFWAGGLALWLLDARDWNDSGQRVIDWFDDLSGTEQVLVAIGALLVLAALDTVVRKFSFPMLQLLEGYGLLVRLPWLTAYQSRRLMKARADQERLVKREPTSFSPTELDQYSTVTEFVRRFPESSAYLMPTRLGNILRAAETWPRDKYGLDAVICWPRLWLVLDDEVRSEISKAQKEIDRAVVLFMWALLLLMWNFVFLSWLVLVITLLATLMICSFAYWWATQRARIYADLIEATFDVYRGNLYEALRLEKPKRPSEEPAWGEKLTAYLWWRKTSTELKFIQETKSKRGGRRAEGE